MFFCCSIFKNLPRFSYQAFELSRFRCILNKIRVLTQKVLRLKPAPVLKITNGYEVETVRSQISSFAESVSGEVKMLMFQKHYVEATRLHDALKNECHFSWTLKRKNTTSNNQRHYYTLKKRTWPLKVFGQNIYFPKSPWTSPQLCEKTNLSATYLWSRRISHKTNQIASDKFGYAR